MDPLQHLEVSLPLEHDEKAKSGAEKMARELRGDWSSQPQLNFVFFTEGITNRILCVWAGRRDDALLFRIYGRGSELLIDRRAEVEVMRGLGAKGLAPKVYASFANGLVYAFVPGQVLDVHQIRLPQVGRAVARRCAELHRVQPSRELPFSRDAEKVVCVAKTKAWLPNLPKSFPGDEVKTRKLVDFPSPSQLEKEMEEWRQVLASLASPIVFAHNDLLVKNIVLSGDGEASFIDLEYAGPNYQAVEIGNHFDEWAGVDEIDFTRYPNKEEQMRWLKDYAEAWEENGGPRIDLEHLYLSVNVGAAVGHFFWSLWALIQAANSTIHFDFLQYGLDRMEQYQLLKAKFFHQVRTS